MDNDLLIIWNYFNSIQNILAFFSDCRPARGSTVEAVKPSVVPFSLVLCDDIDIDIIY